MRAFEKLIAERAQWLFEKTEPIRKAWIAMAIGTFAIGAILITIGFLQGDIRVQSLGGAINIVIALPVQQLRRIQSDLAKIAFLPADLRARLDECGFSCENREDYRFCLATVMDEIDDLIRHWGKGADTGLPRGAAS